jgi:hypothetical protein
MSEKNGFEIQVEDLTAPVDETGAAESSGKSALPDLRGGDRRGGFFRGGFGPDGPLSSPWATVVILALILFVWLASVDQQLRSGHLLKNIEKEIVRGNQLLGEQNTSLAGLKSMENILAEAEQMWSLRIPDPSLAWHSAEGFRSFPAEVKRLITGDYPAASKLNDPVRARETLEMLIDPAATFQSIARPIEKKIPAPVRPVIISERVIVTFEGED